EDGTSLTVDAALPEDLPPGYHALRRRGERRDIRLIVAPRACHLPRDYQAWGWAIQLYAARSRGSWGIGDLADLRRLGTWARRDVRGVPRGAGVGALRVRHVLCAGRTVRQRGALVACRVSPSRWRGRAAAFAGPRVRQPCTFSCVAAVSARSPARARRPRV